MEFRNRRQGFGSLAFASWLCTPLCANAILPPNQDTALLILLLTAAGHLPKPFAPGRGWRLAGPA